MLMQLRDRMRSANNQKGFTLVELMVVVIIIGILVAIAVPVYKSVSNKAKLNAHLANIRTIEGAIESYKAVHDTTDSSAISVTVDGSGILVPDYIREWPTKPGTYKVENGELKANPTKAETLIVLDGGDAVTWP